MIVKGQTKQEQSFNQELFIGFGLVNIIAINPTKKEMNSLFNKEYNEDEDKEIEYISEDNEGNTKVRLNFVYKVKNNILFNNIYLIDKLQKNKEGDKIQLINSVLDTTWVKVDEDNNVDESSIPSWFLHFTDKNKNIIGKKYWRIALKGEKDLAVLFKGWLGKLNFFSPETEVVFDTKKLLKGNVKELQELINGEFSAPFVQLFGVKNKENVDGEIVHYQSMYKDAILPGNFLRNITLNGKFSYTPHQKMYDKFIKDINGDYGYKDMFSLEEFTPYNPEQFITATSVVKKESEDIDLPF